MSYRIVADIAHGERSDAVAIMRALEDAAHARGVAITVYGPAAGGRADAGETSWGGHPATGERFVARMRREADAAGDPPMGYGYRRVKATGDVYAIRWGRSGRITGVYGPVLPSCAHDGSDPTLPPYDNPLGTVGRRKTVEWARQQRWEVVS